MTAQYEDLTTVSSDSTETLYDLLHYGRTLDSIDTAGMEKDGKRVWELVIARNENYNGELYDLELSVASWGRILMFDIGKDNRALVLKHLLWCTETYDY